MFSSLIFVFFVLTLTSATVGDENITISVRYEEVKYCFLPAYPEHGRYTVSNYPSATPGHIYPSVKLDVSCDYGYINGNATNSILCVNGFWSATMPRCVPDSGFCTLEDDLRIEYHCVWVLGSLERSQKCPSFVPTGTSVKPICRSPAYFSLKVLPEMHCRDGIWNYKPICKPACGLITQHRKLKASSTNHLELPWHALIYKKMSEFHSYYICGGSLITANKIISSAWCFTGTEGGKQLPASYFVVAVNKMYYDYNDPRDVNSQQSDVDDIKIPFSYQGYEMHYEDNIALMVVKTPFIFHLSVRPVCLDFDNNLDRTQLAEGNSGKIAYWSYKDVDDMTPVLNVDDIHYIKFDDCYDIMRIDYRHYLIYDKFCAGHNKGNRVNHYSDGIGLAFFESTSQRYYLRGVASVLSQTKNGTALYIFTSIVKHEHFIQEHCKKC